MKKIIYLLGFITLGVIVACEREIENNELENAAELVNLTGQWELSAYDDTTFIYGPFKVISLENKATGNDSITIMDSEIKFWKFQVKALADKKEGTFETKLSYCDVSEEKVGIKISNGKILNGDSIYFEIAFEDDRTPYETTYQLKGHRITE